MANEYNRCHLTVQFSANGGTGAPSEQSAEKTSRSDKIAVTVYVPSQTPTKTGCTFSYWSGSDSRSYSPGNAVTHTFINHGSQGTVQYHTITLTAQYTAQTYTISYNANGGTGAPGSQTKTYGVTLTLSSTVPTRTNYIFQGWSTSSTGAVQYQPGGAFTTNANTVLYAIWKQAAATLDTVSNTEIGASGTATWTIINTAHTYRLALTFPNAETVEVESAANTSSCSFTIPSSWLSAFANAASGTATGTLYTYNDGTLVGSTSKSFTITVPSSIVPSISAFTVVPHSDNSTVEGWGVGVQGYSYFTLSVTTTPGTSATIASIAFSGHQIATTSTSTTADTAVVTSTGSLTYTVTVTDSRGRTATQTATVTVYEYSNPTISELQSVRCLQDGTASDTEGNYLKAYPIYVFSSVNGNNTLTVKEIDYKAHDSSTWLVGVASASSGAWSSVFGTADVTKAFDVRLTITDSLGNTYALEVTVPSVVGYSFGLKNDRVRFGAPVRQAGFECDFPAQFDSTVDIVQRRCEATLSTAGWYRVLQLTAEDANYANGRQGSQIDFVICRRGENVRTETHAIKSHLTVANYAFTNEDSVLSGGGVQLITKIRCTRNDNLTYWDIYYVGSYTEVVTVDFVVHDAPSRQSEYEQKGLVAVADSPSGETVLTEYLFVNNTPKILSATSTASIASGAWTTAYSLAITKGKWRIFYRVRFPFNATGYRATKLTTAGGSAINVAFDDAKMATTSVFETFCTGDGVLDITHDTDTLLLRCIQSSGSTLSVAYYICAIRIA